jgi:NAD(P)-dependent dehydrogenase (short-subunit alcohol dehydrogenase family)
MEELRGKVAVVTGAASGIGLGMAQRFAAEGMRVVMADVERNALQTAVDELAATGADVIAAPTDTSVFDEVDALAARTLDRFGAVHVLCNNAGVGSRGLPFRELPLRDFEWVLGVNLWGVIHGLHAFLPHLRLQDEGHVVNTASVSALYHLPSMAPYNASKAAVLALSETLKFELDAEGSHVGVSVLCPSWVRTNISTASRNLPERLAYELTTEQMAQIAEYKDRRKQQTTTAMEPDEVAEQVCDAIRTNRFYVITHPASIANMQDRFDRIVSGENPIEPDQ